MTPRLNRFLLVVLLATIVPMYWLLFDNRPGDAQAKPVSIAQLRALAAGKPGDRPQAIQFEALGWKRQMRNFSAAGRGLRLDRMYTFSYRLEFADRTPVLINSGLTYKQARNLDFGGYFANAQARVNAAMREASHIVMLNSRLDLTGGVRAFRIRKDEDTIGQTIGGTNPDGTTSSPYVLAPGVVVIPTPERLAKTRLVYVRMADGREYLFAGGLSPRSWSWTETRAPARYLTDFMRDEHRDETYAWLLTLRKLKREAPGLVIVSGGRVPKNSMLDHKFPVAQKK